MDNNALVPMKQSLVLFYGNKVLSARLYDGRIAVSMNSLCKMFKLAKHGQIERIRRDEELKEYLLLILVKTPGGPQRINALIAEAVPSWVRGIQDNLIAPEKRPLIRSLKVEFILTLYHHFFTEEVAEPTPEPQAVPPPRIVSDTPGATPDAHWERLFEALHATEEALHGIRQEEQAKTEQLARHLRALGGRVEVVEEWLTSLDRHVAAADQGNAVESGQQPLLSAAHLADLRTLFGLLEQATGRAQAQFGQEMLATFGVSAITAIPDEQWPDVLAWCWWRAQPLQTGG